MDKTLERNKDLRSPHFVRNRSRSSCREDNTSSIRADLDSRTVRRPRSSSMSRSSPNNSSQTLVNVEDTFQPMWSWYYGESGQPDTRIHVSGMQSLYFISPKCIPFIMVPENGSDVTFVQFCFIRLCRINSWQQK